MTITSYSTYQAWKAAAESAGLQLRRDEDLFTCMWAVPADACLIEDDDCWEDVAVGGYVEGIGGVIR